MKTLKFKSSLKCSGCVNAIKPFMDSVKEISSWNVDLEDPVKIIEIKTNSTELNELERTLIINISKIGYTIEKI